MFQGRRGQRSGGEVVMGKGEGWEKSDGEVVMGEGEDGRGVERKW